MNLAKRMIQLRFKAIRLMILEVIGLRPGEKIYEELLADGEKNIPTHHEKIMIAKVLENNIQGFCDTIDKLINLKASDQKELNLELVQMLKELVPEYKSNNSIYECLDVPVTTD